MNKVVPEKYTLPIEATHTGPYVCKFPANSKDYELYDAAQKALQSSARQEGYQMTQYPSWLMQTTRNVYLRDLGKPYEKQLHQSNQHDQSTRQRGLFAGKHFRPGDPIVPYEGILLSLEDFESLYPLRYKGKDISLDSSEIKQDPAHGKHDVIIQETARTVKLDIHGLTGKIVGFDQTTKQFIVKLDGFREAQHTLSLNGKVFIDAEILSNQTFRHSGVMRGKTYVAGLGAFANSTDKVFQEMFQKKQTANATYWISPEDKKVVLVATKTIYSGDEILIDSYAEGRKFKNQKELWKKLNKLKHKISKPKPIVISKYAFRTRKRVHGSSE